MPDLLKKANELPESPGVYIMYDNTKKVISVELSMGQMIQDVKIAVEGKYPVDLINRVGGMLLDPVEVAERTKKSLEVE